MTESPIPAGKKSLAPVHICVDRSLGDDELFKPSHIDFHTHLESQPSQCHGPLRSQRDRISELVF